MKKEIITVNAIENDKTPPEKVNAYIFDDFFAIYKKTFESGGSTWILTHRGTGFNITRARTMRDCKEKAKALKGVIDWSFTDSNSLSEADQRTVLSILNS